MNKRKRIKLIKLSKIPKMANKFQQLLGSDLYYNIIGKIVIKLLKNSINDIKKNYF